MKKDRKKKSWKKPKLLVLDISKQTHLGNNPPPGGDNDYPEDGS